MNRRGRPKHPDILTPREWEVLALLREELSNDAIAGRLGISVDGVKFHVAEILSKLGVRNRREAAQWNEEQRPWWMTAAAQLSFRWLSPAAAGVVAVAVAVAVAVLLWALLTTGSDEEQGSLTLPVGDKIAYIGPEGDLWVLEGAGTARRLTEHGGVSSVEWSPDGEWITFLKAFSAGMELREFIGGLASSSRQRMFIRPDGSGEHELDVRETSDDTLVSWSPSGDTFTFAAEGNLWFGSPDGPSRELYTKFAFIQNGPAWSPTGESIAFTRLLDGLWLIDLESGEPREIASRENIEQLLVEEGIARSQGSPQESKAFYPRYVRVIRWSPDGQQLAFSAEPFPETITFGTAPDAELLLTVRRDGSALSAHTFSATGFDWAPDGSSLIVTDSGIRTERTQAMVFAEETRLVRAVPGQPDVLVVTRPTERTDLWPRWSPDGTRIAFEASGPLSQDNGRRWVDTPDEGVWVVNADGSGLMQIAGEHGFFERAPRWSKNGDLLLYARRKANDVSARSQLWLVHPDGSERTKLVAEFRSDNSWPGFAWYQAPIAP